MMSNLQCFTAILMLIGYTSNLHGFEKIVWQQELDYIAIQEVKDISAKSQPASHISQPILASALAKITIEPKSSDSLLSSFVSSDEVKTVFTEREVEVLSEGIFSTLQTLSKDQLLVFSVSDRHSSFLGIGSDTLYSSGSVYVSGNDLYLLLAEAQVDIQKKYIRAGNSVNNSRFATHSELKGFKLPTGDYTTETEHSWQLQLSEGVTQVNQRKDWIKIALTSTMQPRQSAQNNALPSGAPETQRPANQNESHLTFKSNEGEGVSPSSNPQQKSEVEVRLEKLKQLYLNGQIPEQVYLEKVNAIIDEI
ncbi:hypothetical protein Q4574_18145 [Aliiglaciecola sp. 3_MG-2023]|uniref:hypothetical protein n=1 Tax=Aliiglaciecola sp. 3_MG-2023 TaxID=3062644 RepID=UPI0026E150BD|nr:hypothetical protein [Aliiglaciecola sp. 3_MG-2023]MDO6695225.1 hypothetical protein [Aliiglaciecola sp. 3_MG-2023]